MSKEDDYYNLMINMYKNKQAEEVKLSIDKQYNFLKSEMNKYNKINNINSSRRKPMTEEEYQNFLKMNTDQQTNILGQRDEDKKLQLAELQQLEQAYNSKDYKGRFGSFIRDYIGGGGKINMKPQENRRGIFDFNSGLKQSSLQQLTPPPQPITPPQPLPQLAPLDQLTPPPPETTKLTPIQSVPLYNLNLPKPPKPKPPPHPSSIIPKAPHHIPVSNNYLSVSNKNE